MDRVKKDRDILKQRRYRERNREKDIEKCRRYRLIHGCKKPYTTKVAAGVTLRRNIYSGKIKRPNECEKCGTVCVPPGHHADYSKPLEVEWLCAICHGKVHRREIGFYGNDRIVETGS